MSGDLTKLDDRTGWTKLFHPRGPQVTLPVPPDPVAAFAWVGAALDAGWLVQAPGLEEGEEKEQVGWVLHGESEREGQVTPYVLLYAAGDQLTWSFLKVYLNKPADVAAYEYASKLPLAQLPVYVGADKPQRGAKQATDKYIVPAPRPFGVVFKKNPKHDPSTEEGKMKPARLFVRWAEQAPQASKPEERGDAYEGGRDVSETEMVKWRNMIRVEHKPEVLTNYKFQFDKVAPPEREELKQLLKARAHALGLAWSGTQGRFAIADKTGAA